MSIRNFLESPIEQWANVYFNNIYCNKINGEPIPSGGFDQNPANIIYRPGSTPPADSNIVSSWADVVTKAGKINVNECLNVYIDSSIVSPALIDQSLDCKGRVRFFSSEMSAGIAFTNVRILDGVVLTNPSQISGTIGIECQSLTGPNIVMPNGGILVVREGGYLTNTSTALVPSLQIANGEAMVFSAGLGGRMGTSAPGVALVNVGVGSTLIYTDVMDTTGQTFVQGSFSSTDNSATLISIGDSSFDQTLLINPAFTGNVIKQTIDKALNMSYDDTAQAPISGSSNVQGVIDWLKTQIGGGGGSPLNDLIYRPGAVSSSNIYGSWAEILTVSSSLNNLVNIFFDDSIITPCSIDASHDFEGNATFNALNNNPNTRIIVQIENGVLIKNFKGLNGQMTLNCDNADGNPSIGFDQGYDYLDINGAIIDSTINSTNAYLDIPVIMRIGMFYNAQLSATTTNKAITIQPGATLFIGSNFGSVLQSDIIYSLDNSSNFFYYADSSQNTQTQNNFTGTLTLQNADNSAFVYYNDNLIPTPLLSADTVQGAIDQIKTKLTTMSNIIYKQGGGSGGNQYGTWAEILTVAGANNNVVNIYFDTSVLGYCEIDLSYDFQGRANFYGIDSSTQQSQIRILDGVTIRNVNSMNKGVWLQCFNNISSNNCIEFDNFNVLTLRDGAYLDATNCAVPPINIPNNQNLTVNMYNANMYGNTTAFIGLGTFSVLFVNAFDQSYIGNNAISSIDASSTYYASYDSSSELNDNNQSGFTGNLLRYFIDLSKYVKYNDGAVLPPLNTDTVQGAIDALKQTIPSQLVQFRAVVGSSLTNVTGNGTPYTVVFGTESYDPNNVYNNATGVFTAPSNGTYLFTANVLINNLTVAHNVGTLRLIQNTNVFLDEMIVNPYSVSDFTSSTNMRVCTMAQLQTGWTVEVQLNVTGGAQQIGIAGVSPNLVYSSFCCKQLA